MSLIIMICFFLFSCIFIHPCKLNLYEEQQRTVIGHHYVVVYYLFLLGHRVEHCAVCSL